MFLFVGDVEELFFLMELDFEVMFEIELFGKDVSVNGDIRNGKMFVKFFFMKMDEEFIKDIRCGYGFYLLNCM